MHVGESNQASAGSGSVAATFRWAALPFARVGPARAKVCLTRHVSRDGFVSATFRWAALPRSFCERTDRQQCRRFRASLSFLYDCRSYMLPIKIRRNTMKTNNRCTSRSDINRGVARAYFAPPNRPRQIHGFDEKTAHPMASPKILLSAGEASSDMYAARLATALKARTGAEFFGMGGPRMKEAGVDLIADYHDVAVVGISEVLHKIPSVVRVQNRLAREAVRRGASLAILIDSPGTHLGVARRLKRHKIPVGYFIGPQVWAWRAGRLRIVRRRVRRMVVIFPFEEKIYRDAGVPVDFVGHPLVDTVRATMTRAEFAARHGLAADAPIVALLPGSRRNEIAQNYPTILEACRLLRQEPARGSQIQFIAAAAPGLGGMLSQIDRRHGSLGLKYIEGATYDALASADCAVVASGTATLEAALLGTPMVVVYRVAPSTAFILRRLIRTPFFSMANLIAGRQVVRELMQNDFTPAAVADEVSRLLDSSAAREQMKADLAEVREKLGPGGAIERAADVFARMLQAPRGQL